MNKRGRVIGATIIGLLAVVGLATGSLGGGQLQAAGVAEIGLDLTQIFIWSGIGLLVVSALLFISANSE